MWNMAPQPRACSGHVCWGLFLHQTRTFPVTTMSPFQPVLVASIPRPPTGPNLTQASLQETQSPKSVLGI